VTNSGDPTAILLPRTADLPFDVLLPHRSVALTPTPDAGTSYRNPDKRRRIPLRIQRAVPPVLCQRPRTHLRRWWRGDLIRAWTLVLRGIDAWHYTTHAISRIRFTPTPWLTCIVSTTLRCSASTLKTMLPHTPSLTCRTRIIYISGDDISSSPQRPVPSDAPRTAPTCLLSAISCLHVPGLKDIPHAIAGLCSCFPLAVRLADNRLGCRQILWQTFGTITTCNAIQHIVLQRLLSFSNICDPFYNARTDGSGRQPAAGLPARTAGLPRQSVRTCRRVVAVS